MNKSNRRMQRHNCVFFHDSRWLLNVYIIQADENEKIAIDEAFNIIDWLLNDIEKNCISAEFEYFRTGFAFLHYGNRGVNLDIWHIGRWGDTYEFFKRAWYCYNRALHTMETLDDAEPVLSQYEIEYLGLELTSIAAVFSNVSNSSSFQKCFLLHYKNIRPQD